MPNTAEEENFEDDKELDNQVNPLEMSDEDIDNFDFEAIDDVENTNALDEDTDKDKDTTNSDDTKDDDDKIGDTDISDSDGDDSAIKKPDEDDTEDKTDENKADATADENNDEEDIDKDKDDADSDTGENALNFETEYNKLLAPFRANNKDMQIENVEDARTLMQMGANYNKKMAGLKPNLKLLKMLENNDLLSEEKLSYLIDLDKKNPGAVTKLLKESGVDPLEIDMDAENEYKTNTAYNVNDKEVDLDGILGEIQDTESFNTTVDIISNKWDDKSKQMLLEHPEAIKNINDHVATGIFERITGVVEQERMLGKLTGLSDLEAYKTVGDAINAVGGFDEPNTESNTAQTVKRKTNKQADDTERRNKKKSAGSTKATPANGKDKSEFNPLSLSDEAFEKMAESKFI